MAFRLEKESNGDTAIVIDGFDKGIAPDPYSGTQRMLQVNLETPGEVSVGYPLTTNTVSGGTLGIPIAKSVRYFPTYATPVGVPTGAAESYAILDASGFVWQATSISGTWTRLSNGSTQTGASNLDGIAYWLGYLWKTRNNAIDYWNGTVWVNGWNPVTGGTGGTPLDAGVKHFMYVATNNQLYITNGNTIARIFAPDPSAFNPTLTSTYNFNAEILKLPVTDTAQSLAEVGSGNTPQSTLLIGGSQNAIYPWDKISTSFNLPIYVPDGFIKNMVSVNQNAFIFPGNAGGRGRIYITNGTQADLFYKIPDYIFNEQDPYYEWGDAVVHRNNLLFGFFVSNNSGVGVVNQDSVWALRLSDNVFRSISSLNSATGRANAQVIIPAYNPKSSGFSYITAFQETGVGATNKIAHSGTTAGVDSIGSNITTDLIPVGTFLQKRTFKQVEFKLRTPLASGENIIISPIVDGVGLSSLSFQPTVTTGSISGVANVNFQGAQWLNFNISLIGNSATSGVRLREIRVR